MTGRRALGALEAEVLGALASHEEPATAGTVRELIGDDLAYTTVSTILTRLCEKKMVTRERQGRSYRYSLAVDEGDMVAERMRVQLRHASDRVSALGQFVTGLDAAEEEALRQVLDDLDRKA